jgi:hypothetical protein
MKTTKAPQPKRAHSVSWQPCRCGCGHFYIELFDPGGRAFAEAWFALEDLRRIADAMYAVAGERRPALWIAH